MKQVLLVMAILFLSSCNRDNEPPAEVAVVVKEVYMPVVMTVDRTDAGLLDHCRELNEKLFLVRSAEDLPDDPMGFTSAYRTVNFKYSDLLITYRLHRWGIDTYRNRYVRNNIDKTYDWYLTIGISDFDEDADNSLQFTRFAITVPKIPEGYEAKSMFSLQSLGWDWDQ